MYKLQSIDYNGRPNALYNSFSTATAKAKTKKVKKVGVVYPVKND